MIELPEDTTEEQLLHEIDSLNKDADIDGFIVQLPLPKQIDEQKVLMAVDPDKDVDGFHPVNVGRLMIGGSEVKFPPCTPAGIQEMIVRSGTETKGAEVVVGRVVFRVRTTEERQRRNLPNQTAGLKQIIDGQRLRV